MKILVLGATGFLGRNSVEYFAAKGHEVHAIARSRRVHNHPSVEWHYGDLCVAPTDAHTWLPEMDVIIQAAAATSGCKDTLNDPAMHIAQNAVMNSYILKEAAKAKIKHVIFPSCSVMYPSSDKPLKETDFDANTPLNPAYLGFASTKLYCEKLCEFYANISDTKFTVMRNSNFYGPHDKYDLNHSHVFGATVTKVLSTRGAPVEVWGNGLEARDFVYVEDFCRFVEAAITHQKEKYALYNCGSGKAVQIKELVEKVIAASGDEHPIVYNLAAPTIPTSLCLDASKAKEELGWEPTIDLHEGIKRTVAWWKENCAN